MPVTASMSPARYWAMSITCEAMSPSVPAPGDVFLEPPGERGGRIGRPALQIGAPHVEDFADGSLIDEFLGEVDRRNAPVLVGVHGDDPLLRRFPGGLRHGLRVLQCRGDWLFRRVRLPCVQRSDGDFGVGVVRRADAYHVDLGIVDDVAPVRAAFFKAEAFFRVRRDFRTMSQIVLKPARPGRQKYLGMSEYPIECAFPMNPAPTRPTFSFFHCKILPF